MSTIAIVPQPAYDAAPCVYCPSCGYDLASWEIHLLKHTSCAVCERELELGLPVTMRVLTRDLVD
jgi:hypothetical protein